jgi:hypothetical protein
LAIIASGDDCLAAIIKATEETHTFIAAMGGTTAPTKSKTFGSTKDVRVALKAKVWPTLNQPIPMVYDLRDLGAHLDSTMRRCGTTLTKRLRTATTTARRCKRFKKRITQAVRIMRTKTLKQGLYGADITPASGAAVRTLSTAMVNALTPAQMKGRSVSLTFAVLSYPKSDIDPDINILVIRAAAFRRFWYKAPQYRDATLENLRTYTDLAWKGTQHEDTNTHIPAPPLRAHQRSMGCAH